MNQNNIMRKLADARTTDEVAAIVEQEYGRKTAASNPKYKAVEMSGGNAAGHGPAAETKAVSRGPSPLNIPASEYRGLYEAALKRLPTYRIDTAHMSEVSVKAPFAESGFTSGTLPPTLMPGLTLELPYEYDRAFEHFKQMPAPESIGVEYLQHTSNASPAAPVAELGTKPDLGMVLTTVTQKYQKIAATASVSWEALSDFEAFMAFVPRELQRAVVDAETNQVISGNGTSPNLLGILNVSGVLTRAIGSDTAIDCIRKGIDDIRIGSAFAKADLILTHPTTWQDITLTKGTNGQYLLNPNDPAALSNMQTIFGCKVIVNSYVPAGTAIVCDSNWIYAWTRHGLTIDMNSHGVDASGTNLWTQNAISFRCEERIAIGVARPTAVNIVTGLPST
jgi:Phage capsid family